MFERILVPLDGSEIAEMSLPYAEELARGLGTEIILFHACGPDHREHEHMHAIYLESLAGTLAGKMKVGQPDSAETRVTTKMETGGPQGTICNLVERNDVGLIIMTATGGSGINVAMLGSVADYICRTAPIPVMLIRPLNVNRTEGKKRLINRILLPLDGSSLSRLALSVAEELAARLDVPITLFQMARMSYPTTVAYVPGISIPAIDYAKLNEGEEKWVRAEIVTLQSELRKKGLTVNYKITSGTNAANDIIDTGKEVQADLIIMSSHGRSGFTRWALGSVAERVLRYGGIPLLLVNARAG